MTPTTTAPLRVLIRPGPATNPYIALVMEGLRPEAEPIAWQSRTPGQHADIFHLHWPEHIFGGHTLRQRLRAYAAWWNVQRTIVRVRRHGALVLTLHNLVPHEPIDSMLRPAYGRAMDWLAGQVDVAIALSATQIPELVRRFPLIPPDRWRVAEHPHYRTVYTAVPPRVETRARLGVPAEAMLIAMAGAMRSYKGIPGAIRAFRAAARNDEMLLVAGGCKPRLEDDIRAAADSAPNVRLSIGRLPEAEYGAILAAADVALFNFRAIQNSGSVFAALSLDRPVIVPRAPVFEELAGRVGDPRWITLFDGDLTPETLRAALDALRRDPPRGRPDLSSCAPEIIGAAHRAIYREALALRQRALGNGADRRTKPSA